MTARTLYDRLWESHTVHVEEDGTTLLYIDRQPRARSHEPGVSKA